MWQIQKNKWYALTVAYLMQIISAFWQGWHYQEQDIISQLTRVFLLLPLVIAVFMSLEMKSERKIIFIASNAVCCLLIFMAGVFVGSLFQ